ncbi:hypothetical protein NEDG_02258, partial [Nematocida displodere]
MRSKIVRYFGKVFETSLGKRLGKVFGKALRSHVLCLILLCVIVGCAEETVPAPLLRHIVSPYTEQTIAFFEKSSAEGRPNQLRTVQIDESRCILRVQAQHLSIYLNKHTLETVPEKLVEGIKFQWLTMKSDGPVDIAVLDKILSVFGRINVSWLELADLEIDEVSSNTDEYPQTPKCVLNVAELWVTSTLKSSIVWFQDRVDLSESQIRLILYCKPDFGNLEVLDGFNAAGITRLMLYDIANLDSLDCKLLREAPLPNGLDIGGSNAGLTPKISEEVVRGMLTKEWVDLSMPVEVWEELMKPNDQPKHLTVDSLTIYLALSQGQTLPSMGMSRATAKHLTLNFRED